MLGGVVSRPSTGSLVHYAPGPAVGAYARVDLLSFLAARLSARYETGGASFDDGALGLPHGTTIDEPALQRVTLDAALEPEWTPTPRLALYAGIGIGWGRTTAPALHASGAESLALPPRAAVFVETPLALGFRYEVLPNWLVVDVGGSVAFLASQSGALVSPYETPGKRGTLVTASGFPELGTSWGLLAGLGVLL